MTGKAKLKIAAVILGLISLVVLWQVGRYYYFRGWERGTKSGYLRKLYVKGPPYCKYIAGEVVLQRGGEVAQGGEVWEFSVDGSPGKEDENPIVKDLRDAEKSGKLTTFKFRRDLHMWWRCTNTEYFVEGTEK